MTILVEDVVQWSKNFKLHNWWWFTTHNFIISSLFAGTCFRNLCLHLQPYSNCQIPLLVSRCQLFNGFMYFEIKNDVSGFLHEDFFPLELTIWKKIFIQKKRNIIFNFDIPDENNLISKCIKPLNNWHLETSRGIWQFE